MRARFALFAALVAIANPADAQGDAAKVSTVGVTSPFVYHCEGPARLLPKGLAGASKLDWKFTVDPAKLAIVMDGKQVQAEIDMYHISFPTPENDWISITRISGRFNLVVPIKNPQRKRPEYLLYEGECRRTYD